MNETEQGLQWVEETITQSSVVDLQVRWAEDVFYLLTVVTPDGRQDSLKLRRADLDDCAYAHNAEVRRGVKSQLLKLLRRLGVNK